MTVRDHRAADRGARHRVPTPTPFVSLAPGATPSPTPAPTPTPTPVPRGAGRRRHRWPTPKQVFAHELKDTWCAPAGVQMVLAVLGWPTRPTAFQRELAGAGPRVGELRRQPQRRWGPPAMALALEAYGAPGYEVRAYDPRLDALRDAATAIEATGLAGHPARLARRPHLGHDRLPGRRGPVGLPGRESRAAPTSWTRGTRELEIWGQSDPPGTFQDAAEMGRNFLPWKRPEGHYPDRDGLFIAVVPTLKVSRATDPDPADAGRPGRSPAGRPWPPSRPRSRAGSRGSRRVGTRSWLATIDDAQPGERGDDLAERVVGRVQPARERVGQASNGIDSANAATTGDVGATSSASNLPPPSRTSTSGPTGRTSADRGERRQDRRSVTRFRPRTARNAGAVAVGVGRRQDREDRQRERRRRSG